MLGSAVVMTRGLSARVAGDSLQVFAVEGGSIAAGAGLVAGDVIREVDGNTVADLNGLAAALSGPGEHQLSVTRGDETVTIRL